VPGLDKIYAAAKRTESGLNTGSGSSFKYSKIQWEPSRYN